MAEPLHGYAQPETPFPAVLAEALEGYSILIQEHYDFVSRHGLWHPVPDWSQYLISYLIAESEALRTENECLTLAYTQMGNFPSGTNAPPSQSPRRQSSQTT